MRLRPFALALLIATMAGVLAVESSAADEVPRVGDPTCTGLTDGEVLVQRLILVTLGEFHPDCVVVANGGEVTWHNEGTRSHNPGDVGRACFVASAQQGRLAPGDSYTVTFVFDEDDEQLRSFHEGFGWHDCSDGVWSWSEDEQAIRVPYECHRHGNGQALIVLEV